MPVLSSHPSSVDSGRGPGARHRRGGGRSADAHALEGGEIGLRRSVARSVTERLAHGDHCALPIAREGVVDPGVGPARALLKGRGEGLFSAHGLAERRPGLTIRIMRRRELRGAPAGFARHDERGLVVAELEMRHGGVEKRRRIVSEQRLRRLEALKRIVMAPGGLQGDAELKLTFRAAGVEFGNLA
jgi:hypothetical protein